MLSRRFSLWFLGALLFADSVSAFTLTYDVTGTIAMTNQTCTPATCNALVTGTMTLEDDAAGNVTLTSLSLAHVGYETANPAFLSIVIARTSITLGAGSVAGTGSTHTSVAFGSTTLNQVGTVTCVNGFFFCNPTAGLPGPGTYPLAPNPSPSPTNLGTWTFDAFRHLSASITYTDVTTPNAALETLTLAGTVVPEPGRNLLLVSGALGLLGLARWRRARAYQVSKAMRESGGSSS